MEVSHSAGAEETHGPRDVVVEPGQQTVDASFAGGPERVQVGATRHRWILWRGERRPIGRSLPTPCMTEPIIRSMTRARRTPERPIGASRGTLWRFKRTVSSRHEVRCYRLVPHWFGPVRRILRSSRVRRCQRGSSSGRQRLDDRVGGVGRDYLLGSELHAAGRGGGAPARDLPRKQVLEDLRGSRAGEGAGNIAHEWVRERTVRPSGPGAPLSPRRVSTAPYRTGGIDTSRPRSCAWRAARPFLRRRPFLLRGHVHPGPGADSRPSSLGSCDPAAGSEW